jgi:acyl carrier protein
MNPESTTRFLAKLAEVFEVDPGTVQRDFSVAGRWDSLAVLSTIAVIDEQFDVTVPVDELTGCTSVADVLALVSQSVEHRSPAR